MNRSTLIAMAVTGSLATGVFAAPAQADCPAHQEAPMKASHDGARKDIVDVAAGAGSFRTLAAALQAADLVGALKGKGPFTVFAPTDDAFAKLPQGSLEKLLRPENKAMLTAILTYHVVPGMLRAEDVMARTSAPTLNGQRVNISLNDGVRVNGARVVRTGILASNGIIHVIDRVLLPSSDSILETAGKAGSFQTLAAAIKTAGLVKTLSGEGPFTVFAPTDAAFTRLPAGTVERLLKPENRQQLIEVLTYHVVPGRVYAGDALSAESAQTVQGSRVRFHLDASGLTVNGATVIEPDIDATNGVIHVIDEVILPD